APSGATVWLSGERAVEARSRDAEIPARSTLCLLFISSPTHGDRRHRFLSVVPARCRYSRVSRGRVGPDEPEPPPWSPSAAPGAGWDVPESSAGVAASPCPASPVPSPSWRSAPDE